MIPLSIPAECQQCGRVFFHVRGQSSHVCEICGGHVRCGYPDCDKPISGDNLRGASGRFKPENPEELQCVRELIAAGSPIQDADRQGGD